MGRSKATHIKEGPVQKSIYDALLIHPEVAFVVRTNAGKMFLPGKPPNEKKKRMIKLLPTGYPDLSGMLIDGRAFYIEVKAPRRAKNLETLLTHDQKEWRDLILKNNGLWAVCDNFADALQMINFWTPSDRLLSHFFGVAPNSWNKEPL